MASAETGRCVVKTWKKSGRGKHRKAVECVVPKLRIRGEGVEWLEQPRHFVGAVFLSQRLLQLLDKVPKANGILLIARMVPVGRLVKRETRRLRAVEHRGKIVGEQRRGRCHWKD